MTWSSGLLSLMAHPNPGNRPLTPLLSVFELTVQPLRHTDVEGS